MIGTPRASASLAILVAVATVVGPAAGAGVRPWGSGPSDPRAHVFFGAGFSRAPLLMAGYERPGLDFAIGADLPLRDVLRLVARARVDANRNRDFEGIDGRRVEGDAQQAAMLTLGVRTVLGRGALRPYLEGGVGCGWALRSEYAYALDRHVTHEGFATTFSFVSGAWFEPADSRVAVFLEIEGYGTRGNHGVSLVPLRIGLAFAR